LVEGAPAIAVGLFDDGPKLEVVNEIESVKRRRFRRCRNDRTIVRSSERCDGLFEDVDKPGDDLDWCRPFDGIAGRERIRKASLNDRASQ